MHVTIRSQKVPIIILSEDCTELLAEKLKSIVQKEQLTDKKALMGFLYALRQYTTLVSGQGYAFDIADFFKDKPEELALLIKLIPQALKLMQEEKPVKESPIILDFNDHLIEYYEKLIEH